MIALATRSGRIKRLAVAATMIVLAGLVLAALVVVIRVRNAEQEALRKADEDGDRPPLKLRRQPTMHRRLVLQST